MDNISNTSSQEWYAQGLKFTCQQCGNCCTGPTGYVWFTQQEAKAMADYLSLTVEQFYEQYTRELFGRRSLTENRVDNGDFDCIFLEAKNDASPKQCSIYSVRPKQCRTWPFWPENLQNTHAWRRAGANCLGMRQGDQGRGKHYTLQQIRVVRDSNNE